MRHRPCLMAGVTACPGQGGSVVAGMCNGSDMDEREGMRDRSGTIADADGSKARVKRAGARKGR